MPKKGIKQSRCEGYTVYAGAGPSPHAYLIDMEGEIVHEWSYGGMPVKMLPGGRLLGRKRNRMGVHPLEKEPRAPLEPGTRKPPWQDTIEVVQVDWDGHEEWSYSDWDDAGTGVMMSRQHHDYQREGNPVGYYAPGQDFVDQGNTIILSHKNKVVSAISDKELLDDVIIEVDWNGKLTGFEWHGSDHFDEYGFDDSAKAVLYKAVNFDDEKGYFDWLHINSVSLLGANRWYHETGDERFNPENLIISSRSANFIAIIRRSTGELAWKAGPDFLEGTLEHRLGQFVGQHHAHMIPQGLPGEGNILVFDNGGESGYGGPKDYPRYTRQFSRVIELNPVSYDIVWNYGAESGKEQFFSHFISGMQRLPNGNTMVTDGANGRLFEVTAGKEIVWEFHSPEIGSFGNKVYRAYRIPPDWVPGNPSGYDEWSSLYE
jgi:hypothetical protein